MEKLLTDLDKQKLYNIERNLEAIFNDVDKVCAQNGVDRDEVKILAATKTVDVEYINYAISKGIKYIGENKVQELLSKYDQYDLNNSDLHFIGHLQTNKVKNIVDKVSLIHSVDSFKLAKKISDLSLELNKKTDILVEVNIGDEESKSGISKNKVIELVDEISSLEGICVNGIMTIPPICNKKSELLKYFSNMYNLFIDIKSKNIDNINIRYLSMGMSSDYCEAISCGANIVRIGSAIFGERNYTK